MGLIQQLRSKKSIDETSMLFWPVCTYEKALPGSVTVQSVTPLKSMYLTVLPSSVFCPTFAVVAAVYSPLFTS